MTGYQEVVPATVFARMKIHRSGPRMTCNPGRPGARLCARRQLSTYFWCAPGGASGGLGSCRGCAKLLQ